MSVLELECSFFNLEIGVVIADAAEQSFGANTQFHQSPEFG